MKVTRSISVAVALLTLSSGAIANIPSLALISKDIKVTATQPTVEIAQSRADQPTSVSSVSLVLEKKLQTQLQLTLDKKLEYPTAK